MADIQDQWATSKRSISVGNYELTIREARRQAGYALRIRRGQADIFYASGAEGSEWVIKKFLDQRRPPDSHISIVSQRIPRQDAFASGHARRILRRGDCSQRTPLEKEIAAWLDGTVLMPRVPGRTWAAFCDEVRDGVRVLNRQERSKMSDGLCSAIAALEQAQLAHRDLSSQNVFVDSESRIHLIDWDSLFHPCLPYARNTTEGTLGYIAPLLKESQGSGYDAERSWCKAADRFAMAALIVEIWALRAGSPLTHDGGLLQQRELDFRGGSGLEKLQSFLPVSARPLLRRALDARTFDAMPLPDEWKIALRIQTVQQPAPRLDTLPDVEIALHRASNRRAPRRGRRTRALLAVCMIGVALTYIAAPRTAGRSDAEELDAEKQLRRDGEYVVVLASSLSVRQLGVFLDTYKIPQSCLQDQRLRLCGKALPRSRGGPYVVLLGGNRRPLAAEMANSLAKCVAKKSRRIAMPRSADRYLGDCVRTTASSTE